MPDNIADLQERPAFTAPLEFEPGERWELRHQPWTGFGKAGRGGVRAVGLEILPFRENIFRARSGMKGFSGF